MVASIQRSSLRSPSSPPPQSHTTTPHVTTHIVHSSQHSYSITLIFILSAQLVTLIITWSFVVYYFHLYYRYFLTIMSFYILFLYTYYLFLFNYIYSIFILFLSLLSFNLFSSCNHYLLYTFLILTNSLLSVYFSSLFFHSYHCAKQHESHTSHLLHL